MKGQGEVKALMVLSIVGNLIVLGGIWWSTQTIKTEIKGSMRAAAREAREQPQQPQPRPPEPPKEEKIDMSQISPPPEYRVKGKKDAKVVIVEYSDFQCPFCGRWANQVYPELKRDYIDTGKVKIIFKHLPLPFHQYAQKAAEAAECAGDQGKFWEFHDKVFTELAPQGRLDIANLKEAAKQIGLNMKKFESCLDTGQKAGIVQQDMAEAQRIGVNGTPTFFINGRPVRGALPPPVFRQIIEEELKG